MPSFLSLLFCLLFPFACLAQLSILAQDSLIEQAAKAHQFSGVILVAQKDQPLLIHAYGEESSEDSRFRIASITKAITALLLFQEIEKGTLRLTQPLVEVLPEYRGLISDSVQIGNLLNHTSGLPKESDSLYFQKRLLPTEFVGLALQNPPNRYGHFTYNNVDYVLAGLVLERISGTSMQKLLEERLLKPLGLQNTGFATSEVEAGIVENFLYDTETDRLTPEPSLYIENYFTAGALYSSASDLLKIADALQHNLLLSPQTTALMYTSFPEHGYASYGNWVYRYPFLDQKPLTVERRGAILGSRSVLMRFPEAEKTLIMLSNTSRFNPDTFGQADSLKETIMRVLFSD